MGVAPHYQELFQCGNGDVFLSTLCGKVALPSRQSAWSNAVKSGVGYRLKCKADVKDVVHGAVDKYYITRVVGTAEKNEIKQRHLMHLEAAAECSAAASRCIR